MRRAGQMLQRCDYYSYTIVLHQLLIIMQAGRGGADTLDVCVKIVERVRKRERRYRPVRQAYECSVLCLRST